MKVMHQPETSVSIDSFLLSSSQSKIFEHGRPNLELQLKPICLLYMAKSETIEMVCDKLNASHLESTMKIFKSAYY